MGFQLAAGIRTLPRRRWMIWGVIVLLQVLLMGSAFVGGRLLAQQNLRNTQSASSVQLPSQLPKEPAAISGTVQKIQDQVLTVGRMPSGRGNSNAPGASNQTDVAVNSETKFYKSVSSATGGNQRMPGGGQVQAQAEEGKLEDVKIGNMVMVWGPKSGERITAEVIYIQSPGR
ncbi:MAG: hypothetical protein A2Z04_00135 [Chloroflexi bacterium RBG_16_57_9]|nr:MAG: hypothetical protein A2Z04_00135 [Chloroflexi bacterium RBG_16_57_9]